MICEGTADWRYCQGYSHESSHSGWDWRRTDPAVRNTTHGTILNSKFNKENLHKILALILTHRRGSLSQSSTGQRGGNGR